jgi:hypothetical protein
LPVKAKAGKELPDDSRRLLALEDESYMIVLRSVYINTGNREPRAVVMM